MARSDRDDSRPFSTTTGPLYENTDLQQSQHAGSRTTPWQIASSPPTHTIFASSSMVDLRCPPAEHRMEKLERASRFRTRSHILSPPISPTSQPPAHHPRPRDPREISPSRRQSAAVVKDEPGPTPDFIATHQLPANASFPSSMSVSNEGTIKPSRPSRISLADAVSRAFNQVPSPMILPSPSLLSSHTPTDLRDQQHDLFEALARICTNAARTYWRSQCRSNSIILMRRGCIERGRYRQEPYDRHGGQAYYAMFGPHRRRAHPAETLPGLLDFLVRIADGLWDRAKASASHAEELQAVHRMGNLYSWGDRVVNAARGTEALSEEGVHTVVMAARDLASWLLCEEGKREIDGLWEGRWVFRGIGLGRVD
ncbi:MAG: hypothetical protein M1830_003451 [Pleopsidium flavum]|nr:MAG: hypothetical protein M1830_003451 [Pleopsidium flavum]